MTAAPAKTTAVSAVQTTDPKQLIVAWANKQDSWVRRLVGHILASQQPLGQDELADLYKTFLAEKGFDGTRPATEPALSYSPAARAATERLRLRRLSDVNGVNALTPGSVIDFSDGLTILFGENGTGKTGYARILKRLAAVRQVEDILPNITATKATTPEAKVAYQLGDGPAIDLAWKNEVGVSPFTRMAVFDAPSVNLHVDENISYSYTPAELSLFSHVATGIRTVQESATAEARELAGANPFVRFFERSSPLYSVVETLGPTTDLAELAKFAELPQEPEKERARLQREVDSLRANTVETLLTAERNATRTLEAVEAFAKAVRVFERDLYNEAVASLESVREAYRKVREESFTRGELPGAPDDAWEAFVRSGATYQQHLGHHDYPNDGDRCIYCRQTLSPEARGLIAKYSAFLDDRLAREISDLERKVASAAAPLLQIKGDSLADAIARQRNGPGSDENVYNRSESLISAVAAAQEEVRAGARVSAEKLVIQAEDLQKEAAAPLKAHREAAKKLTSDLADRQAALEKSQGELTDLAARMELSKHLPDMRTYVERSKRSQKLTQLSAALTTTLRELTGVSKLASEQFINQDFERLFDEECKALRARKVRLEFVGREGRAQRKKSLAAKYRLSQILSEGEQKVIALADFLAEARLGNSVDPIVFDDPVTSLDHRRLEEVARRIGDLVEKRQVIVFTHDIWLVMELLTRFEHDKGVCVYYDVTDDEAAGLKGRVDKGTGPRWDNEKEIGKRVRTLLEEASKQSGQAQIALVERAYDEMRSWCEVVVEQELLGGVSLRMRPNIVMGNLKKVKADRLPAAATAVTEVFERACRYMAGHSQPLARLGKRPSLAEAQADWKKCEEALKAYRAA